MLLFSRPAGFGLRDRAAFSRPAGHVAVPSRHSGRSFVPPRARPEEQAQGPAEPESDWDRETGKLALRMLTARAAGMVLQNIGQVDTFRATWLQNYCQKCPPIEGNAFLAALMEEKPVHAVDPYTGHTHDINPAAIASAVLATREALAQQLAKTLPRKVQEANVSIMRTHLETHTYVSGSNDNVKPSFRQYRRRRQQRQLQQ